MQGGLPINNHFNRTTTTTTASTLAGDFRRTILPTTSPTTRTTTTTTNIINNNNSNTNQTKYQTHHDNFVKILDKDQPINSIRNTFQRLRTIPIPRWITPTQYQYTVADVFGHLSFVWTAISYAVNDFLQLRLLAILGSISMLLYTYYHPHGRVLYLSYQWNWVFVWINLYRISRMTYQHYSLEQRLPPEVLQLHRNNDGPFSLMNPIDYDRLMQIVHIETFRKGDVVVQQGEPVHCVRMVLNGQFRVVRDQHFLYMLTNNNFISEGGIHADLLIPGTIESSCAVIADHVDRSDKENNNNNVIRVLCWDRSELVHLMERYDSLRRSVQAIMSWDIVTKLEQQLDVLPTYTIQDRDQCQKQTLYRYSTILQALLLQQQQSTITTPSSTLLLRYHNELLDYRKVHNIDDTAHARALAECGWTVAEFESILGRQQPQQHSHPLITNSDNDNGDNNDNDGDDSQQEEKHFWQEYVQALYRRFIG